MRWVGVQLTYLFEALAIFTKNCQRILISCIVIKFADPFVWAIEQNIKFVLNVNHIKTLERKHKNLNSLVEEPALEDKIVLGTMQ